MGRPTFIIDRKRLRELRDEANKTQLTVAKELHSILGKNHPSTDETLERDYQRIERTGKTSRQRAEALAKVFNVTVEVLLGKGVPELCDYLADLASLLREKLSSGRNEALILALEQSADTRELSDEAISMLAKDVGARIEAAQLGRNPGEVAELVEITGLTESELLKPANVQGHWLVIASGPGIFRTELIRGTYGIFLCICDIVGDRLDSSGSDGSIRLFRDEPWFRMEIRHSVYNIRIDFVRCAPSDGAGIHWVRATWRERLVLEDSLKSWAYATANFVTDFEGAQSPMGDVRNLRLLVTEYGEENCRETGRMVISGYLDEMTDQLIDGFRLENSTHWLVLNWLTVDLKRSLAAFLAVHPATCWSVRQGGQVVIDLDEYKARRRPIGDCYYGIKYRINLVEKIGENNYLSVPWRDKDVQLLRQEVEKMLSDSECQHLASNEPYRTFEPYTAEE